jgi:hypothetical protein
MISKSRDLGRGFFYAIEKIGAVSHTGAWQDIAFFTFNMASSLYN